MEKPQTPDRATKAMLLGQCTQHPRPTFSHARGPEVGSDFELPYQPRRMIADPNLVETRPRLVENLPLGSLRCLRAWKGLLSHKGSCISWKTWSLYTFNLVFFSDRFTDDMVHDSAKNWPSDPQ